MTTPPNDGGPAFPHGEILHEGPHGTAWTVPAHPGMSLRDWFSGQALNGILSQISDEAMARIALSQTQEQFKSMAAKASYELADAMLAERNKEKQ